jgi:hypothetical protein
MSGVDLNTRECDGRAGSSGVAALACGRNRAR